MNHKYEIHLMKEFAVYDKENGRQIIFKPRLVATHNGKETTEKHIARIREAYPEGDYEVRENA